MMNRLILIILCTVLLGACAEENNNYLSWSDIPVANEIHLTRSEEVVNDAINEFGLKIFNGLAETEKDEAGNPKNLNFSPVSASLAMSMIAEAGDEELSNSILDLLEADDLNILTSTSNKLLRFLPSRAEGERIEMANSIWCHNDFVVRDEFSQKIADNYYGEVNQVEFGTTDSKNIINAWVNTKTHGYIPYILDDIPYVNLNAIFVNVLYFSGNWRNKFDKSKTTKQTFNGIRYLSNVDMMHNSLAGSYYNADNFESIGVPFEGNYSIYFVLPRAGVLVDDVSKSISVHDFDNKNYVNADINLGLPKFQILTNTFLNDVFKQFGWQEHYKSLEKMGIIKDGDLKIYQKVMTSIDEKGTVAAVVTYNKLYGSGSVTIPVTISFDRPFLYFIRNTISGSVLLAGQVCDL